MTEPGKLYLVATPIGNLADITLRALDVLRGVDFVAAEDTRRTGALLSHYDVKKKLLSFHEHSTEGRRNEVLDALLSGKSCALVSDAGTPLISDPGYVLVKECVNNNIPVESVPGPCAAITAITLSGLDCRRFVFGGFLTNKDKARKEELSALLSSGLPVVLYESPQRVLKTLAAVCGVDESLPVCAARELTKLYEETVRGSARQVLENFQSRDSIRGEFVLVLGAAQKADITDEAIDAALLLRIANGMAKKEAVTEVAALLRCAKNRVYQRSLLVGP